MSEHVLRLTRDLRADGYGAAEVRRLERTGRLRRVRRGAWEIGAEDGSADLADRSRHLRLIDATIPQCDPDAVLSHGSAAAVHGLPWFADLSTHVQVTKDRAGHGQGRRHVRVHGTPLLTGEVTQVGGRPVTTLARTVVDLARATDLERGVAFADAASRLGLDPVDLQVSVKAADRRHGIGVARRSALLMDGRSESVGESFSRVLMAEHGLPAPEPQRIIRAGRGLVDPRVDFCWEECGVVGEFDGRIKYGRALNPGQDVEEVLFDEKVREDRLRELGWIVVRWIWDDFRRPYALVARIDRALRLGVRQRQAGTGPSA